MSTNTGDASTSIVVGGLLKCESMQNVFSYSGNKIQNRFVDLFFQCPFIYRSAVRLCMRAHTCFPESEMFASLSTLTAETLMSVLGLIFKGEAIKHSSWCISTSLMVFLKELRKDSKWKKYWIY